MIMEVGVLCIHGAMIWGNLLYTASPAKSLAPYYCRNIVCVKPKSLLMSVYTLYNACHCKEIILNSSWSAI